MEAKELEALESDIKQRFTNQENGSDYLPVPPMFEVRNQAGDHPGFDVDYPTATGNQIKYRSQDWLSQGLNGIRWIGDGIDKTHMFPNGDSTITSSAFNGIVMLENMTLHLDSKWRGAGKGMFMGFPNPNGPVHPNFCGWLRGVKIVADNPFWWALFSYQCDWILEDVTFDPSCAMGNEHDSYIHGFASKGAYYKNVNMYAAGAEGLKFTARPRECRFVPNPIVRIKDCTYRNWYQPHSFRGGAGLTAQASTAHIVIEDTYYHGHPTEHIKGKCVMIDGNGTGDYNAITGELGTDGPYNGHIYLKRVAMHGAPGATDYSHSQLMRVGNQQTANGPHCARTLTMDTCGLYGERRHLEIFGPLGDAFKGKAEIKNCNTQAIANYLGARGIDTSHEAVIIHNGLRPLSQGLLITRD